jgi:hypothetical protein
LEYLPKVDDLFFVLSMKGPISSLKSQTFGSAGKEDWAIGLFEE